MKAMEGKGSKQGSTKYEKTEIKKRGKGRQNRHEKKQIETRTRN